MNLHPPKLLSVFVLGLLLASCAPLVPYELEDSIERDEVVKAERVLYDWNDDYGPGEVTIGISRATQKAYFRRGGRQIGWCYVATGKHGHTTPAGTFKISEMKVDKESNRYGWIENEFGQMVDNDASPGDPVPPGCVYVPAPMPYWMRLTSYGIGMHAGYIPNPGHPASHGCIRMPKPLAPKVFAVVKSGTVVEIE